MFRHGSVANSVVPMNRASGRGLAEGVPLQSQNDVGFHYYSHQQSRHEWCEVGPCKKFTALFRVQVQC